MGHNLYNTQRIILKFCYFWMYGKENGAISVPKESCNSIYIS